MLKEIPVLDPNTGLRSTLQGEYDDRLSDKDTIYIDNVTGEPHEAGEALAKMPNREMFKVPRTTWHAAIGR